MVKILTITRLHLRTMLTSPAGILLMFVMPIIFSIIFGGMSSEETTKKPMVSIVAGKDETSKQTVHLLKKSQQYEWVEMTEEEAKDYVKEQKAIAAIIINENLSKQITNKQPLFNVINLRETQEYLALNTFLEGLTQTLISSYQFVSNMDSDQFPVLLKRISEREAVKTEKEIIQRNGKQGESVSLMTIGFTIMFMMFGISGASSTILDEKKAGTWQRLLTTPAKKGQIMLGYLLSYFLMGWIQLIVLMSIMSSFFEAKWGNLAYFIPFASLVILTVVGFGLMIAGLVKTSQQAGALSAVLIVSTCMLGGVYWPLDIVPEFMQQIAKGIPQSWMMEGLREIITGSLHTSSLIISTIILFVFAAVFFTIGLTRIKY